MRATPHCDTDVLIAGAGPTGLVLALWLTRMGVRVRIVDKTAEPGTTSRALGVQARTLEFYRQMGLAEEVVERGHRVEAINVWVAGKHKAHAAFGAPGAGISPFPFALIYPQDEHERMLIGHLTAAGVRIERGTELLGFEQTRDRVRARLQSATGPEQIIEASYLAGCDGAHSTVRETLKIDFPGGQYEHLFYVADVEAGGEALNGELHVALDRTDFLAVFPLRDPGRARLVGTVRGGGQQAGDGNDLSRNNLSWNDVSKRVIEWMRIDVRRVNWFSTYRVHHRVADHFAKGRAFLLGDAAHVHSPVGAQGMNTGIGDAVNLAWKLAAVLQGRANPALVTSYEPERIAFARRLVATTDRAFVGVTSHGAAARFFRLTLVPAVLPLVLSLPGMRRFLFRTMSQTAIHYRDSFLSDGRAGAVHAGDRLPWVAGQDNFAALDSLDWQVHVYGEAPGEIRSLCETRRIPLHVFAWNAETGRCGLHRNAVYLIRPDGYVGFADVEGRASLLTSYLDARKLAPRVAEAVLKS